MTTTKKSFAIASLLAVSVAAMFGIVSQQQISAEESDERQYATGNDVKIYTEFIFRDAVERSNGFQIYHQVSGFDRINDSATFTLSGVVDYDRTYLYEAADMTFVRGITNTQHDYGQFDVNVHLQKDGISFRSFEYTDCSIIDYKVDTLSDKEEGWTTSKGFTTIDEFEFGCNGYRPINPLFDSMESNDVSKASTQSSMDLKDTQSWSENYR
jgi:hypothetical protein